MHIISQLASGYSMDLVLKEKVYERNDRCKEPVRILGCASERVEQKRHAHAEATKILRQIT